MTLPDRRAPEKALLILAALFALGWAVVRAVTQSVTIDEAFTYLYFVSKPFIVVFEPNSNNHILNSLLMWFTTRAFGPSPIALRLPALLGAALYIGVCYYLCNRIADRFSLRLPLFICLVYNPFIFDFLVAARGYSLADAFLLTALAIPVWHSFRNRPSLPVSCAIASIALALSFTANFSFAFVDAAAFLAIALWAIRRRKGESIPSLTAYSAVPGLLVALLLCGYTLAHWTPGLLWWGAHSLREMRQSLVQSSFFQLDPPSQGTVWYRIMNYLRPRLPPLLVVLCLCQLLAIKLDRTKWRATFAAALAGIAALSVTISWLAFHFDNLPLPLGRTGIYLVPMATLIAGLIAAAPSRSVVSQWLNRGLTAAFLCLALYFVSCLRLSYFKEYKWDADMKDVYCVIARLNHRYGVSDAAVTGYYVSALNYYRVVSNRETFPNFELENPEIPIGRSIYVLGTTDWHTFIAQQKLAIIYRGNFSDVVVAVRPNGPIPPDPVEPLR